MSRYKDSVIKNMELAQEQKEKNQINQWEKSRELKDSGLLMRNSHMIKDSLF